MADTNGAQGIISSFEKMDLPSELPKKAKGNGMMNKKDSFSKPTNQSLPPAARARKIQLAIRNANRKYTNNETA
tara:strand:- start:233 stop:454 length:222 start_codon:yes stop_codon:yes gene_type:complete